MSRTLAGTSASGVTAPVTLPGYFVEFGFTPALRLCSRGNIDWAGQSWLNAAFEVEGFDLDSESGDQSGVVSVNNSDYAFGTLVLAADDLSAITLKVWEFYTDAPATDDPVPLFNGLCDGATLTSLGRVAVTASGVGSLDNYSPRTYMTVENGFTILPSSTELVTWGGETVRLTSEGI